MYVHIVKKIHLYVRTYRNGKARLCTCVCADTLQVAFAKEPHKRDYILQKRPSIYSILLTVAIHKSLFARM